MKIAILMNRITWEIKQIINEFEKRHVKADLINNQKVFFSLTKKKDLEGNYNLFLERSLSHIRGLFASAILDLKGYKVINNHECLNLTGNKLLTTLKLVENDIPTPNTCIAFTKEASIKAIEEELNYPVVIKPIIGSWGRLIAKLDDYNSAMANLECREIMGNIWQKIYYLQRFIGNPAREAKMPTDIRVIVIGDQCIAAMGRSHPNQDFRANLAIGGIANSIEITKELEELSLKSAKVVHGEILGIDIMQENENYEIIEINGTPQFRGITKATRIDIASRIVDYIMEKYV
ncbi:MAG: RimK family alpha-L-glutamate ligase [Promethearchaeota archaeon]